VLRVVALGDNAPMHRVLCAWVALQQRESELCASLDVRVYVIPMARGQNDVARFLAERDDWYRRQVYSPFAKLPLLCPRLSDSAHFSAEQALLHSGTAAVPTGELRDLFGSFVRGE
jgi:hypothetical protein